MRSTNAPCGQTGLTCCNPSSANDAHRRILSRWFLLAWFGMDPSGLMTSSPPEEAPPIRPEMHSVTGKNAASWDKPDEPAPEQAGPLQSIRCCTKLTTPVRIYGCCPKKATMARAAVQPSLYPLIPLIAQRSFISKFHTCPSLNRERNTQRGVLPCYRSSAAAGWSTLNANRFSAPTSQPCPSTVLEPNLCESGMPKATPL